MTSKGLDSAYGDLLISAKEYLTELFEIQLKKLSKNYMDNVVTFESNDAIYTSEHDEQININYDSIVRKGIGLYVCGICGHEEITPIPFDNLSISVQLDIIRDLENSIHEENITVSKYEE